IRFHEELDTNFVAYIPHLFFYVIPVALGDVYLAQGRYSDTLKEYQTAQKYTYLNLPLEAADLWQRMAQLFLKWGDYLFRQGDTNGARSRYENIVTTAQTVPLTSPLYQPAAMASMITIVGEAVKELKGEPHQVVNPQVAKIVMQANLQLQKIAQKMN